jgi:hypothetical protein
MFRWKRLFYARENTGRNRPLQERLSSSTRQAIEESSELDLALYKYACERFDRQLLELGNYQKRLRLYRAANALYAPVGATIAQAGELKRARRHGSANRPECL